MRRKFIYTIGILAAILLATSCQYKFIVEPVVPPPDPEDTVYYSQEIEPIFGTQGCTGCHTTGATKPDLTIGNSYNSITSMGLVVPNDPDASKIYFYPLPDGSHYAKYTSSQGAIIFGWIDQGALDN